MYNEYFGFAEPPFNITPSSKFYFHTQSCEEILPVLRRGIAARKEVMVITGVPGTGKTLLLRLLEEDPGPSVKPVALSGARSDFDGILHALMARLALEYPAINRTAALDQLTFYLVEQHRSGKVVCLLLDEAQDLGAQILDELRLLTNLEHEGNTLLPLVLVGQPELNVRLDDPAAARFKQRVSLSRTTHPLIRMEVAPYIEFRLTNAGYTGGNLFEPDAIVAIADYSGGIPRLINSICDNSLLRAYNAKSQVVSAEMVEHTARELRLSDRSGRAWYIGVQPEIGGAKDTGGAKAELRRHAIGPIAPGPMTRNETDAVAPPGAEFSAGRAGGEAQPETVTGQLNTWDEPAFAQGTRGFATEHRKAPSESPNGLVYGLMRDIRFTSLPASWYGIVATVALAIPFATLIKGSQIPDPAGSIAHRSLVAAVASASRDADEAYQNGWREAVFTSPSSEFPDAPPRIGLVSTQKPTAYSEAPASVLYRNGNPATVSEVRPATLSPERASDTPAAGETPPAPKKKNEVSPKTLTVTATSLVRRKPRANAEIIASLEPGSRVIVLSKSSDFYQVRSVENKKLRGYVHREDAFFEGKKQP